MYFLPRLSGNNSLFACGCNKEICRHGCVIRISGHTFIELNHGPPVRTCKFEPGYEPEVIFFFDGIYFQTPVRFQTRRFQRIAFEPLRFQRKLIVYTDIDSGSFSFKGGFQKKYTAVLTFDRVRLFFCNHFLIHEAHGQICRGYTVFGKLCICRIFYKNFLRGDRRSVKTLPQIVEFIAIELKLGNDACWRETNCQTNRLTNRSEAVASVGCSSGHECPGFSAWSPADCLKKLF